MFFVRWPIAVLSVSLCTAAIANQAGAVDLKIMPVGDSITYGSGGSNAGYRGLLYSLLGDAGVAVQYVGDSTLNSGSLPSDQTHHAGHASYTTYDIAGNLNGLDTARYKQYGGTERDPNGGYWITGGHETGRDAISPDVVLLMVGVNDLSQGQGDNAQTNLQALLSEFTTLLPEAKILIADLPPSTLFGETRINAWNGAVDNAVSEFQAAGKKVFGVDLNSDFPTNGLTADGVHPNDIGYTWMATRWSEAITATAVPEPNAIALLITGLLAAIVCIRRGAR